MFRNIWRCAAGLALLLAGGLALAQVTPNYPPRIFPSQQTHYTRFTVAFNSCVYAGLTCSVKVGALPYNAFMVRGYAQDLTTWNAGTSASVALGTAPAGAQIQASTARAAAGAGAAITLASIGVANTGNGIAQSGANGGFDVYATITIVGALPTAGQTVYVLEYAAPNDGTCTLVPVGSTAPGC